MLIKNKSVLRKSSRSFELRRLLISFVNSYNHKLAKENLNHYQQLAIFSFDHIGLSINIEGLYERESLEIIGDFLRTLIYNSNQKVALDIGANIGNHSLYFSNFFEQIYAFEPNPYSFALLKINSEFSCPKKNIQCRNYGLSSEDDYLLFRTFFANIGASSIVEDNVTLGDGTFLIEVKKADTIKELIEKDISLIKIDVEGHELRVLIGLENLIKKNKPIILFEQKSVDISCGSSEVIDYLKNLKYEFATIERNFYFGDSSLSKISSIILRSFFGNQLSIVKTNFFQSRFHDMVIASPIF